MSGTSVFLLGTVLLLAANLANAEHRMTVEQMRNAVQGVREHCGKFVGVNREIWEEAAKGNFIDTKDARCFHKCLMESMKSMRNDKLMYDVMIQNAEKMLDAAVAERVKNAVNACREKMTSTDGCDLAFEFTKCYYETDPSLYI